MNGKILGELLAIKSHSHHYSIRNLNSWRLNPYYGVSGLVIGLEFVSSESSGLITDTILIVARSRNDLDSSTTSSGATAWLDVNNLWIFVIVKLLLRSSQFSASIDSHF
jgi:hypothetical protein